MGIFGKEKMSAVQYGDQNIQDGGLQLKMATVSILGMERCPEYKNDNQCMQNGGPKFNMTVDSRRFRL